MKYKKCMIVWSSPAEPGRTGDPTSGRLMVVPFGPNGPEGPSSQRAFSKSMGACDAAVQRLPDELVIAKVLADYVHLVRDEKLDPARVHRAFMAIDEYREIYTAEPMIGSARLDDSDPRFEWEGIEIEVADLPTWDEAVQSVQHAIRSIRRTDPATADRLRDALDEAIAADVAAGRMPRVEVQGLRIGLDVAGAAYPDEALRRARTFADTYRDEVPW